MRSLKLLFVLVVLALSLEAAWTPTCTSFVYVNGINTSNLGAAKTVTDFLQPQFLSYLTSKGKAGYCYSIHLSYNASQGFFDDMKEFSSQTSGQSNALDKYQYHEDLIRVAPSTDQAAYTTAATTTPFTHTTQTFAMTNSQTTPDTIFMALKKTEQDTVISVVKRLLTEIQANRTAVCVGHSQGNYFCNLAYRVIREGTPTTFQTLGLIRPDFNALGISLPDPKVLQVISIATPASFTADGRNQYVTVCKDIVLATPNALPANYDLPSCTSNWWNSLWNLVVEPFYQSILNLFQSARVSIDSHLIETYLAPGTGTQNIIMQMMENALTSNQTTITFGPTNSDDVWVTSVYYGGGINDGDLRIGGWGDSYFSLFKFNLSAMPLTATKAELRFYKFAEGGNRSQIYLDRITSSWTENTRWANKPTIVNLSTLPQPVDNQWYTIDITNLYNSWQSGTYPNHGIMMRPTSTSNNVHNAFRSSEYTNSTQRPQLVLTSAGSPPPTNTRPTITLSGANPLSVSVGTQFVEPGYTANDAEDGNITAKVLVTGTVNNTTIGTYTKTYSVTDNGGLSASKTRTVNVVTAQSSGSVTTVLGPSICNVVWVTDQYYGFGQHDADMRVGGWGDEYYSLLKCTLSSMPISATKVLLRLFEYPGPSGGSRVQMYLDRITSSWDNSTKWQTKPTSVNIATLPIPVDNQWYDIDITALYNSWQNGSFANYGIMLRPVSNSNVFNFFRSTEYSVVAFRPQLSVTTAGTPPASPLTGACSVNGLLSPVTLQIGNTAYFGAGSTGGTAPVHFLWTGATGGDVNNASQVYNSSGTYNVSVRLTDSASPPQQVTVACPQVTVSSPAPPPLSVSCSFNPSSIILGANTTMVAGALGGYSPYTYKFPGESVFGTSAIKTFTGTSVGTFSYTAYTRDSRGSIATSPSCSFSVRLGNLSATNARATPNPVRRNTNLLIQLWGSNFASGTTQVSLLGPGCLFQTSCPIPVTVVSSGYIESRLTVINAGSYTLWLRNGSGSWILAPVLTLIVTN